MKFTLSWLKEHLETQSSLEQICETLTSIGFEIESVDNPATKFKNFYVARIIEADKHPQADRLKVCRVETAGGVIRQIVCGASNARAGLTTILATPDAVIPATGDILTKGKIRGIESEGMMCSERELALSDESEGIIEIPDDILLGTSVASILGLDDPIIDISVTPNRPDGLGVYGIARDLAAKGLGFLKPISIPVLDVPSSGNLNITLETENCPHFVSYLIEGVSNKPSPVWLQNRLKAVGINPISVLVDITNYVMMTYGRPLHVFDADCLKSGLTVKNAVGDETFTALNGKTYTLPTGSTVICDAKGVISLAGIMGGDYTGCTSATTRVLLESAWFDPISISSAGRATGLLSDARYRFERGVDPAFTSSGAALAASLIVELAGGTITDKCDAGKAVDLRQSFNYDPSLVKKITGLNVPKEKQLSTLLALGFECQSDKGGWVYTTPSWRPDIHTTADLVEEVIRLYGVDNIPSTPLPSLWDVTECVLTESQKRHFLVKRLLANRHLRETVSFSFISEKDAVLFEGGSDNLRVANPISVELSHMRPSLLPSLLKAVSDNLAKGQSGLSLFEVAPVYKDSTETGQFLQACGIREGFSPASWTQKEKSVSVYDVKADLLSTLEGLGVGVSSVQCIAKGASWYHPARCGTLQLGPKVVLGTFGEIHPRILKEFDIKTPVVAFEMNMDALPAIKSKGTNRPALMASAFHPVYRDFAFLVNEKVTFDDMLRAVRKADKALIEDVRLFDIYKGTGVGEGQKSVAFSVKLQPTQNTLTDSELESLSNRIIAEVVKATNGILRA